MTWSYNSPDGNASFQDYDGWKETFKCNNCNFITTDEDELKLHDLSGMILCEKCMQEFIQTYD